MHHSLSICALAASIVCACSLAPAPSTGDEPEVRTVSRLPWNDSTRCFHMYYDSLPEFLPHARFADANMAARQFRSAAIGSKDHCCRDNESAGIDCQQEGYWRETTWLRYELMQCDADVVSVLLVASKSWGGSGVGRKFMTINVSGSTGWTLAPPETVRNVSMGHLAKEMKRVFIEGKACMFNEESWSQDIDQLSEWYQEALEELDAFVVKDGEWHWVINGHPDHCNAGQTTWAIPTGVRFAP